MTPNRINRRCRHFVGSKPCAFNKADGSECPSCQHVSEFQERILFVKLDAIGDVLRSASLLPLLRARHAGAYITWLTRKEAIDLVRMVSGVDEAIELDVAGLARLTAGTWNHVYSLSNDPTSASLASLAAKERLPVGFYLENGLIQPSNAAAEHWLEMAAFDRIKRQNTQSYQRLMCNIIGATGDFARPSLNVPSVLRAAAATRIRALFGESKRRRVAVNLGSGARWPKKMIDAAQIAACSRLLRQRLDVDVMLVGGAAEAEKAQAVMAGCPNSNGIHPLLTTESIPEFVAILTHADALLCGDTLAMHIATAIGLPAVVVFGPTSQAEIADFDGILRKTWTDELDCLSCYGDCDKQDHCMSRLEPEQLVQLIGTQLLRPALGRTAIIGQSVVGT